MAGRKATFLVVGTSLLGEVDGFVRCWFRVVARVREGALIGSGDIGSTITGIEVGYHSIFAATAFADADEDYGGEDDRKDDAANSDAGFGASGKAGVMGACGRGSGDGRDIQWGGAEKGAIKADDRMGRILRAACFEGCDDYMGLVIAYFPFDTNKV